MLASPDILKKIPENNNCASSTPVFLFHRPVLIRALSLMRGTSDRSVQTPSLPPCGERKVGCRLSDLHCSL